MEDSELLSSIRQIVREEMRTLTDRMDAQFDRLETRFDGVFARLDRIESIMASTAVEYRHEV